MLGLHHPFSGASYEQDGRGHILVTTKDGRTGVFSCEGRWIEGEVFDADPQLCGWIGGPKVAHHRIQQV